MEGYFSDRPYTVELAARTLEALRYVSHGLTYKQAGAAMFVGTETVKTHLERAHLELRAKTTTHAVATALRLGLID